MNNNRQLYYKKDIKIVQPDNKNNDDVDGFLFIEQAGITMPDPNYYIRRGDKENTRHYLYVIEYVLSGKGYIDCNSKHYEVNAGDFYFLNRYASHEYYADAENPYTKIWINISGRFINYMTALYNMSDSVIIKHVNVENIFNELFDLLSNKNITQHNLNRKMVSLLSELFYEVNNIEGNIDTKKSNFNKIRAYIDKYSDTDLTIQEIADHFFMSTSTLMRCFIENVDMSPKAYIQKKRISIAKNLLETTDTEINTISTMLHFCHSQHFSNTFKKMTGLSPIAYRNKFKDKLT